MAETKPCYPIRSVVSAANVQHDTLFQNMTQGTGEKSQAPKVRGCLNQYDVLKDQLLGFFAMASSVAAAIGSNGQTNYSAGRSILIITLDISVLD